MVHCRINLLPVYGVLLFGENMVTVGVGTVEKSSHRFSCNMFIGKYTLYRCNDLLALGLFLFFGGGGGGGGGIYNHQMENFSFKDLPQVLCTHHKIYLQANLTLAS